MSRPAPDAASAARKCEDSTDSDNDVDQATSSAFLRRISTSKCLGRLPVVKEGYLMKQTRSFQRWQRRYFQLRGRTLYYAKDKESQLLDEFDLEDATFAECSIKNIVHSFQVITARRCLVLSAESRAEMEGWAGALRGALHRGSDVGDLVASLSSGDHHWYAATHARPTFCNVCREPLGTLGTAHALACELCKFKAHKRCAARAPPSCKWTTLASLASEIIENADGSITMPHQWLEGNLPVSAKCSTCDKTCGSVLRLQDFRCVWCRRCVHAGCRPGWRTACELGAARASIVPPTHLHSVGPDDAWEADRPPGTSPLVVFVNSKSGDNQGIKFLRRFKQLLNPAQVFELSGGTELACGPRLGLRLFRHFAPLRVLVCSGDGSVGWVLQEIDKLDMHKQTQVAVLPLGTGNDLARVLGWGACCDDAANLLQLLERYEKASTKMLDRWSIMTFERPLAIAPTPAPPPAPPDRAATDEATLLKHLHNILQATNAEAASESAAALCSGAALLAAEGEHGGVGAARAALRLRRSVTLLLHARQDHIHNAQSWDLTDTSESEPEPTPSSTCTGKIECTERAAIDQASPHPRDDTDTEDGEKGSREKTEKEQLNSATRGSRVLAARADSVRRALRNLLKQLKTTKSGYECESSTSPEGTPAATTGATSCALPVPRAFADGSRRSSAASNDAAVLHPDNIPDVDDDIAKLISSNPPDQMYNLNLENKLNERIKLESDATTEAKLPISNLSSSHSGSCRNLSMPPKDDEDFFSSSTLTIPNLVVSDSSSDKQITVQGQKYESDRMTIIDIDKPYTDDEHFEELSTRVSVPPSADNTPDKKVGRDSDSDCSNISEDFSLVSEVMDHKPIDVDDTGIISHIDSPEMTDTTYANSETLHGESIIDDISSMLGQEVLLAMMGKNGENDDDTTLFTSDTVSDIALDSRNPSLEKYDEGKMTFLTKLKKPGKEVDVDKFGFENRAFNLENSTKSDENVKYCSLAQFVEGNDIARKSFKKNLRRSKKLDRKIASVSEVMTPQVTLDSTAVNKMSEINLPIESKQNSPKIKVQEFQDPQSMLQLNATDLSTSPSQAFPQVSVVVEPPSPAHSDEAKSMKTSSISRMANVLNDFFDQKSDSLSVKSTEGVGNNGGVNRERRSSDNPNLLNSDPEYNKFLSSSPAATRRISCGSLFKPGEADKLSASVSSIWGDSIFGLGGSSGTTKIQESGEKQKQLPIINPLVMLPAWPHVTGGFISQCLLANADALCAAVSPLMDPDETLLEGFDERAVMNNYFGIGIDAKITLDFHNKREEHPEKCRSRARNYMWYGVLGSKEWVNRTYRHLGQRVQLECDGQRIPLPELQGIVVLNIPSFMGGTNFWGGTRGDDLFLAPSFDDRILEVVAVFGSAQMAASRLLNLQKHRIAQCRAVQINILGDECVPVQVDGEAWLQPPGCIRIIHKNRAQMLCRSRALESSLKTWDEKQQMKHSAIHAPPAAEPSRNRVTPAETAQLLIFMDAVNTLVKWVKLSCISESGRSEASAASVASMVPLARRVAAHMDALQDTDGRLLPGTQLRLNITNMVHSCQELVESVSNSAGAAGCSGAAVVASVRAHLARCEVHDGLTYLHAEEVPKKQGGKVSWLRTRKSISESAAMVPTSSQVRLWGVGEVCDWLTGLQLAEYVDSFTKNDITGKELLSLARRDLKELGVTKVGHVKRILQAIKEMQ